MRIRVAIVTAAAFLLLLVTGTAIAQGTLSVPWSHVPAGGGQATGGTFSIAGSAGQPAAASLSGGTYSLKGGYWTGQAKDEGGTLFLPLIVR